MTSMTDHKVGGHFAAMQRSESVINLWKLFKKDQRKEKDHMCFFAPFYFRWFRSNTRNARDPRLSQGTDAPLAARSILFCRYHARACRACQGEKNETKYVVQGGDWGSVTAQSMAMMYPKSVTGIHLTFFATLSLSGMLRMAISMARPRIQK